MDDRKMTSYFIHAVTPLHVGSGRGLGYIDLPIMREKVTDWPYVPGSSIKGVISDHFGASDEDDRKKDNMLQAAFGMPGDDGNAGSLVFTDARLLCMPIRSFYGTFAWITSPFAINRFHRDTGLDLKGVSFKFDAYNALISKSSVLTGSDSKIYLEDLDIPAKTDDKISSTAREIACRVFGDDEEWCRMFTERFAVVGDDVFTFLCKQGTEVNARIRIDGGTGVVKKGALWYEESLPVETILYGEVWCDRSYIETVKPDDLVQKFCSKPLDLQMGGKASTGKGLVRCIFADGRGA